MNHIKKAFILGALACIFTKPGLSHVKPSISITTAKQQNILAQPIELKQKNVFRALLRPTSTFLASLALAMPMVSLAANPAAGNPHHHPSNTQEAYQHASENWREFRFNRGNRHIYLPSTHNRSVHGHQLVGYKVHVRAYDRNGIYQDYHLTTKRSRVPLPAYMIDPYQRFEWNVYPIVRRTAYDDLVLIKDLAFKEAKRDTDLVFGKGSEQIDGLSDLINYALKELYEDEIKDELGYEEGRGINTGYYGDHYYGDSYYYSGSRSGHYSGKDVHRKVRNIHQRIRRQAGQYRSY